MTKKILTSIKLDEDIYKEFKKMVIDRGSTISNTIEDYMRDYVGLTKKAIENDEPIDLVKNNIFAARKMAEELIGDVKRNILVLEAHEEEKREEAKIKKLEEETASKCRVCGTRDKSKLLSDEKGTICLMCKV